MWSTSMICLSALLALTLGANFTLAIKAPRTPTACNGFGELCNRTWSSVTQMGSHDSAFVGTSLPDNQHLSVTQQLNLGIRFLQAQVHYSENQLSMCHTSCSELNAGTLVNYLTTIRTWMEVPSNADEVLTLLLVNGDDTNIGFFALAFFAAGLETYAYAPPKILAIDEWPTLQELIIMNKRIVVFIDEGASTQVPWINSEWIYFFETPFDVTDKSYLSSCQLDRPSGASPVGRMYIVNHFLDKTIFGIDIPDESDASSTNAAYGLILQGITCSQQYGHYPKGVLLDWVDIGDPFTAQNWMNRVS